MNKALFIIFFGISSLLFPQLVVLELDTFNRSIPTANFGGQTWRGPSWVDSVFNDSVATMFPDVLAYPPSPDLWDWENGWFYPQSTLDTCCVDSIELTWGQANATVIEITPENFQSALDQIGAEGLYCLNMISSSIPTQLASLHSAKNNGVSIERIRLGDEMGKAGNEHSISHFPTAEDYAATCDIYIDSIRSFLPNTKIAVSAGNFGASNPRAQYWNNALYNMTNPADAFRWSAFFYLKDADTLFTTKQLLAYAFDQIPAYEAVREFQDTTTNLQPYELWVGYGITDNTSDHRFRNRWSLVLMFSASHQNFLNNKLVEDISMFNVGGIFENWDALDTQNNYRKRATGVFASIWNQIKSGKNKATKIKTPINLIDTVTYLNNNGVPREVEYPKLFGWRFENETTQEGSIILTNISPDTILISIDDLLVDDDNVLWKKWYSDSLYDVIDADNYINTLNDTGTVDIALYPYSINVAKGSICSEIVNYIDASLCEGDTLFVANSIYTQNGVYIDSLNNVVGCDSVIITNLDLYPLNSPLIILSSSTLETEPLMTNYQWYLNGDSIAGANQFNYLPLQNGAYTVSYIDNNGCETISNSFVFNLLNIYEENMNSSNLVNVIDVPGNMKTKMTGFYLEIYEDGSVKKKYFLE